VSSKRRKRCQELFRVNYSLKGSWHLFFPEVFNEAAEKQKWALFPALYREEAIELTKQLKTIPPDRRARLVADTIAGMTDEQALRLYQRLSGHSQGPVLDPIIR
jgi:dGTP triphosphohydrolase